MDSNERAWVCMTAIISITVIVVALGSMYASTKMKISAFEHGYVQTTVPGSCYIVWVKE